MTDELISRRDAIDELTKFFCDNDVIRGDFPNCERNERKATVLMENVRSIDAEPVIRCCDCVHFKYFENQFFQMTRCDVHDRCPNYTDFCSWAERKEE